MSARWFEAVHVATLPPLPKLQAGDFPTLTMVRVLSADRRLVLRAWRSTFLMPVTERQPLPILLASIVEERATRPFGFLTISTTHQLSEVPGDIARLGIEKARPGLPPLVLAPAAKEGGPAIQDR